MRISDWSSDVCSSDLLPVGMAVREHGEIAMREGRLGMRQRLQSDSGIGDDRRAVLARNVAMICNTLGVFALGFAARTGRADRSEEHTSELQSLMRISYAVFCLKKKKTQQIK